MMCCEKQNRTLVEVGVQGSVQGMNKRDRRRIKVRPCKTWSRQVIFLTRGEGNDLGKDMALERARSGTHGYV
jgi:hypothetical protein